jgi:histidyl-tRNA synthetase
LKSLRFICDNVAELGLSTAILDLDVTLARGLNYYTGAILRWLRPNQLQWDPLAVAVDMMI